MKSPVQDRSSIATSQRSTGNGSSCVVEVGLIVYNPSMADRKADVSISSTAVGISGQSAKQANPNSGG
jgi:hypothetical protein